MREGRLLAEGLLQTATPTPWQTPTPDQTYTGLDELFIQLLLFYSVVYAALVILIAAPTGVYLISNTEPDTRLKATLTPPAVGIIIHVFALLTVLPPEFAGLLTLFSFLPAVLILLAIGYSGSGHYPDDDRGSNSMSR